MAASDTGYLAHFLVAFKMESIWVSWKLNERQKKGVGIEIKRHITYFREQIELRVAPKEEVEKPWVGPKTGCFFKLVTAFGQEEIGAQKIKKQFFSNICYIL